MVTHPPKMPAMRNPRRNGNARSQALVCSTFQANAGQENSQAIDPILGRSDQEISAASYKTAGYTPGERLILPNAALPSRPPGVGCGSEPKPAGNPSLGIARLAEGAWQAVRWRPGGSLVSKANSVLTATTILAWTTILAAKTLLTANIMAHTAAEVLAIGDELTSGQRVDTNSAWLSQQLGDLGIKVKYHTTVADDLEACRDAFRAAMGRTDLVVATGGLGPTADDLTRDALALATDRPLREDAASLQHIRALFASRGREMPPQNQRQALFPLGSQPIPNPHGTAPGIDLVWQPPDNSTPSRFMALPGVPAEMREMWYATVRPSLIQAGLAGGLLIHRRLKCFGVGESDLEQRLPDLIRRGRDPSVGITVHRATITLRITALGTDAEACHQAMLPTVQTIRDCLGDLVFGEEDDELEHAVLRLLAARAATLATSEAATEGMLARWLHRADAGQRGYRGGWVGRGSAPQDLAAVAASLRESTGATFALCVGPVEAPTRDGGPPQVAIQLLGPDLDLRLVHDFTGHPDLVTHRCAKVALDCLRRSLLVRQA